jgi:hypothetical protein
VGSQLKLEIDAADATAYFAGIDKAHPLPQQH